MSPTGEVYYLAQGAGVEPTSLVLETSVLPLNYPCMIRYIVGFVPRLY